MQLLGAWYHCDFDNIATTILFCVKPCQCIFSLKSESFIEVYLKPKWILQKYAMSKGKQATQEYILFIHLKNVDKTVTIL